MENNDLVALAKTGDETAKTMLLNANSPLIKSIIKRYVGRGVDYDDLYQLGCMGFVKAIGKYDSAYNVKFTTYAVPLMAGEVKRFLRDDGTIKVSRSVKSLYVRIKKFLAENAGAEIAPKIDEIATALEASREDVIYAMEAAQMPISLYDKGNSGDGSEGLCLAERLATPADVNLIDKVVLKNLLASLEDRDRKVMILRYFRNNTQSEVATRLGISQVQVSRIEQKILAFFREEFSRESV